MIRKLAEKIRILATVESEAPTNVTELSGIFGGDGEDDWKNKRDKRKKCDFGLKPNVKEISAVLKKNMEITGADSTIPTPSTQYDPSTGDGKTYPGVYGRDSEWRERKKKNDQDVMSETKREKTVNDNTDPDSATGKGRTFQGPYGRDSEWREKKVSYYKKKLAERIKVRE